MSRLPIAAQPARPHDDVIAPLLLGAGDDHPRDVADQDLAGERHTGCLGCLGGGLQDVLAVPALQLFGLLLLEVDGDLPEHDRWLVRIDDVQLGGAGRLGKADRVVQGARSVVGIVHGYEQFPHGDSLHGCPEETGTETNRRRQARIDCRQAAETPLTYGQFPIMRSSCLVLHEICWPRSRPSSPRPASRPTKFGVAAVNDGHLVANLRKGTSVTLKTADRVRAYMASQRQRRRRAAACFT